MNILICGVGYIAQELLKRLGESWKTTLVDKDETILTWRVEGILRNQRLVFPEEDTVYRPGDRLLMLGRPGLYEAACSLLECSEAHFPRTYGHHLVLGMPGGGREAGDALLNEGLHLAQNIKIQRVVVLCREEACEQKAQIERWANSLDIELRKTEGEVFQAVEETSRRESAGLVLGPSGFKLLYRPDHRAGTPDAHGGSGPWVGWMRE